MFKTIGGITFIKCFSYTITYSKAKANYKKDKTNLYKPLINLGSLIGLAWFSFVFYIGVSLLFSTLFS